MPAPDAFDLTGKVVLVTGAAGFLGQQFVAALTGRGATVVASDVADGADLVLDITDRESVEAGVAQVIAQHGQLDVLVHSAAIDPKVDVAGANQVTFTEYPEEAMRQSLEVNILGAWRMTQAAVRQMLTQSGGGNIVLVSSFYGVTPPRQELYPGEVEKPVDYPMTKAALVMLMRHIASQFGRDGIRANALAPGGVVRDHDQAFQEAYAAHTSLGRMNTSDEVADALVWLASEASRGMTGETLVVDAGWQSR